MTAAAPALPATLDGVPLRHHRVPGAGVVLHLVDAGPPDGAPVVLLHGFPEWWFGWRRQIPALARAGYRVLVPDQRGYGASDRPARVADYAIPRLVADVRALLDTFGPAHLVGHDWGGAVAWAVGTAHPERLRSLTVLNCPHPRPFERALRSDPAQMRRSTYMALFQLPWVAERVLTPDRLTAALRDTAAPGTFDDAELALYRAHAWSAGMSGPLAWYRAAPRHRGFPAGRVRQPVRLIWGTGDHALGEELVDASLAECDDGHAVRLPGVSHWCAAEAAAAVNDALLAWFADHGGPDRWVYKLVPAATWAVAPDPWPGSADDLRDGFVHLSSGGQVEGTRARYFADQADLLRLAVDPALLPPGALRFEPSRDGRRFPHLYAPLPRGAVVDVRPA